MADRPFGFGLPDKPEDQGGRVRLRLRLRLRWARGPGRRTRPARRGRAHGAVRGDGRPAAVRRRAAPVRRHAVLARRPGQLGPGQERGQARDRGGGDPSILDAQRRRSPRRSGWPTCGWTRPRRSPRASARSRLEPVGVAGATFPIWAKLCDPIAAKGVEAMSACSAPIPRSSRGSPEEVRQALGALGGGAGGLGGWRR